MNHPRFLGGARVPSAYEAVIGLLIALVVLGAIAWVTA